MAVKRKSAEEIKGYLFSHPDVLKKIHEAKSLKAHMLNTPFWVLSIVRNECSGKTKTETTLMCPECGELFVASKQYSNRYGRSAYYVTTYEDECCPKCLHSSQEAITMPTEKEGDKIVYPDRCSYNVFLKDGNEYYLARIMFDLVFFKEDEKWLPSFDIKIEALAHQDPSGKVTKYKNRTLYTDENADFALTSTKMRTLFSSMYYMSDASHYIEFLINASPLTIDEIRMAVRDMDETKSRPETAEKVEVLDTSFPKISLSEYFGILHETMSFEEVSRETTYKALCLCCGHEWLHTSKDSRPHFVCPVCGAEELSDNSYYSHRIVLYLSATETEITGKVVSYSSGYVKSVYEAPELRSRLENVYTVTYTGKATTFSPSYSSGFSASPRILKGRTMRIDEIVILNDYDNKIKYSGVSEYFKTAEKQPAYVYMQHISNNMKNPLFEKIAKSGLAPEMNFCINDRYSTAVFNKKAETIHGAFCLSPALLRAYRKEHSDTLRNIATYQDYYKRFPDVTAQQIAWAIREEVEASRIEEVTELASISISDATGYLERVRLTQMFSPVGAVVEWRDYLKAAKSIDMDMTDRHVLYPRALKTEHDIVVSKSRFIADDDTIKKFGEAVEKYKHLEYHKDAYFIRVPASTAEMLEEGRKLRHCCGRYVDDVARGTAFVLFLRKKADPDTPFLSMEVLPTGQIRQVRGMNDSYIHVLPDHFEINAFLKSFARMKHLEIDLR